MSDATEQMRQMRLKVASLEEKNLRLARALQTARERLSGLESQVEQIHRPPAQLATFVAANEDREEIEVVAGGKAMWVAAAPDLDFGTLSPGQEIRLDAQMVAVEGGDFSRHGALASVIEVVDSQRALIGIDGGGEHLVRLAGPLRHGNLKPGDTVSVDLRSGFAFERLVRQHIEQLFAAEVPDASYGDIGGLDTQIELVRDAVEMPFRYPELYRDYGLRPPRGILLYGPPGCGKTLIAKAVAASLPSEHADQQTYFISVKGPELLNKYVGETERQIRAIFARARDLARRDTPVVIFFDEIEALFRVRGSGISSDVETMIVPQLLAEMDGLEALGNVIVIGASNRADMIDPAVLRPGRFDVRVRIERPSRRQAEDIFSKYLTPDLPLDAQIVRESGSAQAAIRVMVTAALDRLFSRDQSSELFELHLADGSRRRVFLADLVSGAMIAGTVERAKKRAIKDAISGRSQGIATAHVLAGVEDEIRESTDLAATTSPGEWARTVGLQGEEVVGIATIAGQR